MPRFIIVGCVTDFIKGGAKSPSHHPPPIREQQQKRPSWIGLQCVMSSEAQGNHLLFPLKVMPFVLKIFKFLYFQPTLWFTKSMTSWWVLLHETGYIFEYILWTTTHYETKLDQLRDLVTKTFRNPLNNLQDWD